MDIEQPQSNSPKTRVIDIVTKKGIHFRHYEHRSPDFSKIEKPVNVNGFALDENDCVLLVQMNGDFWGPPGGGIESGETPIEALEREMDEEASVDLIKESILPFFYTDTYVDEPVGTWKYLGARLRYVCRIKRKNTIKGDPDGEITGMVYCPIDELPKYLNWGETLPLIMGVLKGYAKQVPPT